MRISLVNDFFFPYQVGGAESVVAILSKGLLKQGHSIQVVTGKFAGTLSEETINGIDIRRIGEFPGIDISKRLASGTVYGDPSPKMLAEFKNTLEKFSPDVVHFHNIWLLGPKLLGFEGCRKGVTFHDYWPFCLRRSFMRINNKPCREPNWIACRLCQIRSAGNIEGFNLVKTESRQRELISYLKTGDFFTAPSKFTAERIEKFTSNKTTVVYNSIDLEFETRQTLDDENPYFLFASRPTKIKGYDFVVKAFSRPDFSTYHLKIASNVSESNLLNIEKLGWQSAEDLKKLISSSKGVIVPSLWPENSPMIILEALSLGVPVIASKIGGIPELIQSGKTGILIEPGNVEELREAVETCLGDVELMRSTQYYGPKFIEKEFLIEQNLEKWEKLYAGA